MKTFHKKLAAATTVVATLLPGIALAEDTEWQFEPSVEAATVIQYVVNPEFSRCHAILNRWSTDHSTNPRSTSSMTDWNIALRICKLEVRRNEADTPSITVFPEPTKAGLVPPVLFPNAKVQGDFTAEVNDNSNEAIKARRARMRRESRAAFLEASMKAYTVKKARNSQYESYYTSKPSKRFIQAMAEVRRMQMSQ